LGKVQKPMTSRAPPRTVERAVPCVRRSSCVPVFVCAGLRVRRLRQCCWRSSRGARRRASLAEHRAVDEGLSAVPALTPGRKHPTQLRNPCCSRRLCSTCLCSTCLCSTCLCSTCLCSTGQTCSKPCGPGAAHLSGGGERSFQPAASGELSRWSAATGSINRPIARPRMPRPRHRRYCRALCRGQ
jgi:hypothetical protein